MAKTPGMAIYHGESETMESSGGLEPGTVVGWDGNGQLAPTNSGGSVTTPVGVVSNTTSVDHEAGDMISVQTAGTIVTKATDGVVKGAVGPSATDGTVTGGTGAGQAFSAAGGDYRGPIPDGHAAVRLGGVV
jgi:hypothetical protein